MVSICLIDRYFDLRGLSAYSSMKVPTLRDYIKAGGLPCFKLKGKILVKRSEFDSWIQRHRLSKASDLESIAEEAVASLRSA